MRWPRGMLLGVCTLLGLAGCAGQPRRPAAIGAAPVEVQILAINDFHGNLEPPQLAITATAADGNLVLVPAGGAAHVIAAAKALRRGHPYTVTVSAGDMIGASPLVSSFFLDEPTIAAMDLAGVEYNAVGNHELDRGQDELLRIQRGGCQKFTAHQPCALEAYHGAKFAFLSANVRKADGTTLFPSTAIKDFGPVKVGIIGMTLKETATLVGPAGTVGLIFADEAASANALVPQLKSAGVAAIILLIHQGGSTSGGYDDKRCPDLVGDIVPILPKLDPAIDVVVSGHTHAAYVCEIARPGAAPLLLTSAGRFGTLITDIRLTFGATGKLVGYSADNRIVQGEGFAAGGSTVGIVPGFPQFPDDPDAAAVIERYVRAARPVADQVVGRLAGPVTKAETESGEQTAGDLIADATLAAGRTHDAQLALMNAGGVHADLVPAADGAVTFGQTFAVQPFGNNLVVLTLTGAQLKQVLEQQFPASANERVKRLLTSEGFAVEYDRRRAPGDQIVRMLLGGQLVNPARTYRVVVSNFLATGGDGYTALTQGAVVADAGLDVDALAVWLHSDPAMPRLGRVKDLAAIETRSVAP